MSNLLERPGRNVEILGHRDVHEAAHVAQRARDVAAAGDVLGENEVPGPADEALAVARLELENSGSEEDQLATRRVVVVLHVPLRRLAEEDRAASEGLRRGPRAVGHRNAADLDRRFSRCPGEDVDDAHHGCSAR